VRWDIDGIFREVESIVDKAVAGDSVEGIGIDSWGVDFGLIDKNNALIAHQSATAIDPIVRRANKC